MHMSQMLLTDYNAGAPVVEVFIMMLDYQKLLFLLERQSCHSTSLDQQLIK